MNSYKIQLEQDAKKAVYNAGDVESAVNQALVQQALTNQDNDTVRRRIGALISGGYDFGDTLHNIYLDYGYPAHLSFSNFWNMYRRLGIAKSVVEMIPDKGWITPPKVEGLGEDFDKLVEQFNLWQRLKGLDIRQRVGRYAGLFMRVADGKDPHEPIEGQLSAGSLIDITPLYESQLTVNENDNDPKSKRFGLPKMYHFSSGVPGDRDNKTNESFMIHPDRLIIISEGADSGSIYGISSLEAPYNSLMDLRKIIGGGAEGFYKNAAQQLVFELADMASAANNQALLDKFTETVDDLQRNKSRRAIMAPGMTTQTLNSDLITPKEFFDAALADVASSIPMPATILIGQQTGRLASDEDSDTFAASVQSRRLNFMTELVKNVIDWLILRGIIAKHEYEIEWDDLLALSDDARLKNVNAMAKANQTNILAGQDPVFSVDEMREVAGPEFEDEEVPPTPDETVDDDAAQAE